MYGASEVGNIVNFNKLSQEIGIAHTTIAAYYQILEDCLIAEKVNPLIHTKMRRKLSKSAKYLFFDMGIRRVCASEGTQLPTKHMGFLFEQWVGLELIRRARLQLERTKVLYWRDQAGPEVDWIIDRGGLYTPIEVKWTSEPRIEETKYLKLFLNDYEKTTSAYLICRATRKVKLMDQVYALPWQEIERLME